MKLDVSIIPEEIVESYNLSTIQDNNGWVYMKICKGMYGLKQSGIISNLELKKYGKFWLSSCSLHSRSLEALNQGHHLLISSQLFSCQVHVQSQRRTFLE